MVPIPVFKYTLTVLLLSILTDGKAKAVGMQSSCEELGNAAQKKLKWS